MLTQAQRVGATRGWVVNSTPRTFYPGETARYAMYRRMSVPHSWSGRTRRGRISCPTCVWAAVRPAHSETLYELRYSQLPSKLYIKLIRFLSIITNFEIIRFLNFVQDLKFKKEHKVSETNLFPSTNYCEKIKSRYVAILSVINMSISLTEPR